MNTIKLSALAIITGIFAGSCGNGNSSTSCADSTMTKTSTTTTVAAPVTATDTMKTALASPVDTPVSGMSRTTANAKHMANEGKAQASSTSTSTSGKGGSSSRRSSGSSKRNEYNGGVEPIKADPAALGSDNTGSSVTRNAENPPPAKTGK